MKQPDAPCILTYWHVKGFAVGIINYMNLGIITSNFRIPIFLIPPGETVLISRNSHLQTHDPLRATIRTRCDRDFFNIATIGQVEYNRPSGPPLTMISSPITRAHVPINQIRHLPVVHRV